MPRIVEAESVADYLNRYYKKSRMTETLLATYEEEFRQYGYVCTSRHNNVTGEFIAWPFYRNRVFSRYTIDAAMRQSKGEVK